MSLIDEQAAVLNDRPLPLQGGGKLGLGDMEDLVLGVAEPAVIQGVVAVGLHALESLFKAVGVEVVGGDAGLHHGRMLLSDQFAIRNGENGG